MKNVVVCCDGTANEFASNNTNVVKLYSTLLQDPASQVAFYHPGIGTMEPPGALTTWARRVTKLLGMAIGYGLEADIRDAYIFIMQNYQPGDHLYLFGFSRGAYTARAVAALLHMHGLIRSGNESLVPYAIRMLRAFPPPNPDPVEQKAQVGRYFDLAREFQSTFSATPCKPHFVGVWDTVASVGWLSTPWKLPFVTNNPDIATGRHAISIDERRAFFRNHLWRPPKNPADPAKPWGSQDIKQVWFPGVHCDVGGGYAETQLSNGALKWMLGEAKAAGLHTDPAIEAKVTDGIDPAARMHESLTGAWLIAELIPKPTYDFTRDETVWMPNFFRNRKIPPQSFIHESAYQRDAAYGNRLPKDATRVGSGDLPPAS